MHEYKGAARAEWLAELHAALGQARLLVEMIGIHDGDAELLELILRIDAARREIRALQLRGRRIPVKFDPLWSHPSGSEENRTGVA